MPGLRFCGKLLLVCVNCFGLVGQDEADGVQQIGVLLDVPAQVSTAQWQELGLGAALSGRRTSFPHLGQVSAGVCGAAFLFLLVYQSGQKSL